MPVRKTAHAVFAAARHRALFADGTGLRQSWRVNGCGVLPNSLSRRLLLRGSILLSLLRTGAALAESCTDHIAAMYDGGPLDPRDRAPHHQTNAVFAADGSPLRTFRTIMESGTRSVSGVEGSGFFARVLDRRSWTGPTLEGPWTESPNLLSEDRAGQINAQREQEIANLANSECPGLVEIEGATLENLRFTACTDPNDAMRWALLHKSGSARGSPLPGRTYPAAAVTGIPMAVSPLGTAMRT